ncbi:MAG: Endoribonuclease Nob1 [Methanomassiliicoccales archaeon PtaU1.Bin124]|nr:MAG: Endoribonuclease Nob1 [Methanomassiliicoccales archaeon PtaU1.Bin124]
MKKVVLDTSVLFSMEDIPPGIEAFTTPGVIEELRKYNDNRSEYLQHKVSIMEPDPEALKRLDGLSVETGDVSRLSPTDKGLLALSIQLGAELWTDDYSMQNMAKHLHLPYRALGTKGITRVIKWKYRCIGCGKTFDEEVPDCPICGSEVRTSRKKR